MEQPSTEPVVNAVDAAHMAAAATPNPAAKKNAPAPGPTPTPPAATKNGTSGATPPTEFASAAAVTALSDAFKARNGIVDQLRLELAALQSKVATLLTATNGVTDVQFVELALRVETVEGQMQRLGSEVIQGLTQEREEVLGQLRELLTQLETLKNSLSLLEQKTPTLRELLRTRLVAGRSAHLGHVAGAVATTLLYQVAMRGLAVARPELVVSEAAYRAGMGVAAVGGVAVGHFAVK